MYMYMYMYTIVPVHKHSFLPGVEEDFGMWWAGLKVKLLPVLRGSVPLSSLTAGVQSSTEDVGTRKTGEDVCQ